MIRDKDIREPLFDFLEAEYGKIRFIEEKTMGRSRADVVMVTEERLDRLISAELFERDDTIFDDED